MHTHKYVVNNQNRLCMCEQQCRAYTVRIPIYWIPWCYRSECDIAPTLYVICFGIDLRLTFGRAEWGPSSLWWSSDCCQKVQPAGEVWEPRRSAPAARSGAHSWRWPWRSWSPASPSHWRTRSHNSWTPGTDHGQKSETIYMLMVTSVAESLSDVWW